jgi:plastocyanin
VRHALGLAATFGVVLALVVGGAAVAPAVVGDDTRSFAGIDESHYTDEGLLPDEDPGEASVSMDATGESKTVLIDTGAFVSERDVRPLLNALTEGGHEVRVLGAASGGPVRGGLGPIPVPRARQPSPQQPSAGGETPLSERLADADAYVSVGAGGYSDSEVNALGNFTDRGGRVLLTAEPDGAFGSDFSDAVLQTELGVATEPGYVYNLAENDLNYLRVFAGPEASGELTDDVDRVVFPSATPVTATGGRPLLGAIEGSQLSTTRAETEAPVLVRDGNVVLAGDRAFMTPENVQRVDNDDLVGNVADFLVTGEKEPPETDSGGPDRGVGRDGTGTGNETIRVGPDGEPRFEPQSLRIEPATSVEFVWESGGHNLLVRNQPEGANWTGVPEPKAAGFTHSHTFEVEGVYEFASESGEDEGMVGAVLVGDPPQGGSGSSDSSGGSGGSGGSDGARGAGSSGSG